VNRRAALEERFQRESVTLLRRHLATLRASQRGPALPPAPSADDRALASRATPAERARVDALLIEAGFTPGDLARADGIEAVDDLTRARARQLRRGRP
jgi:hypothetical protein